MRAISLDLPLRWRDVDVMGHMYHGRYHELLDEARAAVFAEITGPRGFSFVLRSVTLDHHHEVLRADERLTLETVVATLGTSSVVMEHRFARLDGVVVASGRSTMVAFDREARTKRSISDAERAMLTASSAPATGQAV